MGQDRAAPGSKAPGAYRTISEVAEEVGVPQHVLRFWETKFAAVRPLKRSGNRRYYRPEDVDLLLAIRRLLHDEGYTIKGVQKRFRDQGLRATVRAVLDGSPAPDPIVPEGGAGQAGPPQAVSGLAQRAQLQALLAELKALRRRLPPAADD